MVEIELGAVAAHRAGETHWDEYPTRIVLSESWYPSAPPEYRADLVVHELIHAAGMRGHLDDARCVMWPRVQPLPEFLCPLELSYLLTVRGTLHVRVLDPLILRDALYAVAWINGQVGRELFVVVL